MPYDSELERREAEGLDYSPRYVGDSHRVINQWFRDELARLRGADVRPDEPAPYETEDEARKRLDRAADRLARVVAGRNRRNREGPGRTFDTIAKEY